MSQVMQRARDTYDQGESSSRKKQRLSSPTYDEQYELSLGQIQAFDALDKTISQHTSLSPKSPPKQSQANTPRSRRRRNLAIAMALKENVPKDDMNNVSTAPLRDGSSDGNVQKPKGSQTASDLPSQMKHSEFGSALNVALINSEEKGSPSSSPDISPEPDLAAWFASSDIPSVGFASARALVEDRNSEWLTAPAPAGIAGFQSAKSVRMPVISDPEISDANASYLANAGELEEAPAFTGFTTGSNLLQPGKGSATILMPSAEALAKAAKRLAQWDREFDDEVEDTSIIAELQEDAGTSFSGFSSAAGAFRPALIVAQNSPDKIPPSTPTPAGTSSARSFSPLVHRGPFDKKLEFKPPLLTAFPSRVRQASNNIIGSSVNPKRAAESRGFTAPARVAGPSTPVRRTAPLSSPKKSLGVTPRHAVGGSLQKPTFSTPFKTGIKPGDFGRLAPAAKPSANSAVRIIGSGNTKPAVAGSSNLLLTKSKGKQRAAYIDLLGSGDRQSLATCGLRPQTYDAQELEAMGINVLELSQITPDTALFYSFHGSDSPPIDLERAGPPPTVVTLGTTAALNELHNAGCSLATKQWVENHWGLILWKLAGMVCLDPKSEADPARKRWCWREVMRQLRYRYERELNSASRPPLRLIAAQDSPAGLPMVLCVSNITWTPGGLDDHGTLMPSIPDVEITDGWYRIRAEVDEPLLHALRKGKISIGKKIAVMGARLSTGRKDATEILEGGDSLSLKICGNSTHLAPWHAKLGFQRDPFIATLGSLTPNGGVAAVLDVIIEKVYPIAYLEFVETESGGKRREGPRIEKDEAAIQDKWLAKRDIAAAKLRNDIETKMYTLEGYADRLERKAGSGFKPSADASPPDHIDDLLSDLEDGPDANEVVRRTTPTEAGWLALAIKDKCRSERECMHDNVTKELDSLCPPREVRNFRVLVVRDAQTFKRPPQRRAQITVWDVLTAYVSEDGKPGMFKETQRFTVTNLIPKQHSAWMPRGEDSVIYLATRGDTRWKKHKA